MPIGENATTLGSMDDQGILPKPLVGEIIKKVTEDSVVQKVSGTTPVSITGNTIATQTGDIVAGIVGEGEAKPVVQGGVSLKTFKPIKAAALMYWSKEARIANPSGYLDTFVEGLTGAVTKAVDMAVIHGKDALTGNIIDGVEYLDQTSNVVDLGTATKEAGGLTSDFLAGYDAVVNAGYDFDAFIADPRLRTKLIGATDMQGRPVYSNEVSLNAGMGNFLGLPVSYGKVVGGKVGAVESSDTRAFGGNFSGNLKLGFTENITFKRTDVASINDGGTTVNLWQQNLEAVLVEAIFGWVITDVNGFAKYQIAAEV